MNNNIQVSNVGYQMYLKRKEAHFYSEKKSESILSLYKLYKVYKIVDNPQIKILIKQQIDDAEQIIVQNEIDYALTMKNLIVKQLENIALMNHNLRDQEIAPQI